MMKGMKEKEKIAIVMQIKLLFLKAGRAARRG